MERVRPSTFISFDEFIEDSALALDFSDPTKIILSLQLLTCVETAALACKTNKRQ